MEENTKDFQYCDELVETFEKVVKKPIKKASSTYYCGVDLGTAFVVIAVLNENKEPVAGAYQFANVVKDGMVVDYVGAVQLVRQMKAKLEEQLGTELIYAAAAIPPGTEGVDGGAVKHVVQGAGFEITNLLDEPTAANAVLKIDNGAIVDIGGGTTGISIFKNGKRVYVADEPTGGTHFSLVISGAYQMAFDQAEKFKRDPKNHRELLPILTPVIDKVGSIIEQHIEGYDIDTIYLVGGTCCLTGIEQALERKLGLTVVKPLNPMFVTPLGIALECTDEIMP
ncbi:MAG: ethanolamine utilization protein EutJ [Veillonella sp.]|uniref:ethanolamine utilization protein EutJ n=1 Tax=Veillonella sp. TaxID=1926307 RepID=UPI0025EE6F3C|nr:ethanolamine utilization protein EutJ [Veillonella sp.]MBS4913037.1 ethanolamine utilization protein EutJ [Veillonella sp.]